jgi:fucose permease
MRTKAVHLLALFLMVYIGVEVTIGGISSPTSIAQETQ